MIKLLKNIGILAISLNLCFAQDVVVLKKGEPCPFDGVLFSKEKERELRQMAEDKVFFEKRSLQLKDLAYVNQQEIDVLNQRINNYQVQNKALADRVTSSESNSFVQSLLYFGLGAIITGAAGYAVIKTYK